MFHLSGQMVHKTTVQKILDPACGDQDPLSKALTPDLLITLRHFLGHWIVVSTVFAHAL